MPLIMSDTSQRDNPGSSWPSIASVVDSFEGGGPLHLSDIFLSVLSHGAIVMDAEGTILRLNEVAQQLTGLSEREVVARSIDILPKPLRETMRSHLDIVSFPARCQSRMRLPTGESVVLLVEFFTIPQGPKSGEMRVAIIKNLSAMESLENHVRRLDRLANIGTLSASAAHEIKNCLTTIKTFFDVMLAKSDDAEMGELVRKEIKRIDSTASQLLRFSGPSRPSMTSVSLHRILNNTLRLIQHQLDERDVRLVQDLVTAPDEIRADEVQLGQVFINIFLNAIEAMKQPGEIRVLTRLGEEQERLAGKDVIVIRISDTGEGISPENVRHLFNRFFTTKTDGTGLGLAITQRIIEEHHGDISVESTFGQGTTFWIRLPLIRNSADR